MLKPRQIRHATILLCCLETRFVEYSYAFLTYYLRTQIVVSAESWQADVTGAVFVDRTCLVYDLRT
jgi:hypothetical protein